MNITTDNSITSVNGVYESKGVTNNASNGANKVNADDTAAILTLSRNGDSDGVVNVKRTSSNFNLYASDINNVLSILKSQGYYNGPSCGFVSNEAKIAIKKFEKDYGMKETGELTETVYDRILTVDSLLKNKEMQTQLTKLGFYDGDKKHIFKALQNFQKLYGLTENGKYNNATKSMLTRVYNDYNKLYNSETMNTISKELYHDEAQKDAFIKVYIFLKTGMNLCPNQIAGVMGNMHAESAILPDNVQEGTCPGEHNRGAYIFDENDEETGFGILQWTNSVRKKELKKMAQEMAFNSSAEAVDNALWDLNVQLAYFKREMTTKIDGLTDYSKAWNKIKSTYSYSYNDVSDIFLKDIESPTNLESKKEDRRKLSKIIYDALIKL